MLTQPVSSCPRLTQAPQDHNSPRDRDEWVTKPMLNAWRVAGEIMDSKIGSHIMADTGHGPAGNWKSEATAPDESVHARFNAVFDRILPSEHRRTILACYQSKIAVVVPGESAMASHSLPFVRFEPLGACGGDTRFRVTVIGHSASGRLSITVPAETIATDWSPEARLQVVADILAASADEGAQRLFSYIRDSGSKMAVATDGLELRIIEAQDIAAVFAAAEDRAAAHGMEPETQQTLPGLG